MLAEYSSTLAKLNIILGSQSPRRYQLLRDNLGLKFDVVVSSFAEDIPKSSCKSADEYVRRTCFMKASDIIKTNFERNDSNKPTVLICADTIVVHNNEILEKPIDREHCKWMLKQLSGNSHNVITAVTLATKKYPLSNDSDGSLYDFKTFTESTRVDFTDLSDAVIESYMDTGEPFDKAGSYGIQGLGSSFVRGIHGCYFNVMGFPIHRFCMEFIPYLMELEKMNHPF